MSPKRVRTRTTVEAELQQAIAFYLSEGAFDAALGLVDEFEEALGRIGEYPGMGSARWEAELRIPGLRSLALPTYPYVVFYLDAPDFVDVRHLLSSRTDIPRRLGD